MEARDILRHTNYVPAFLPADQGLKPGLEAGSVKSQPANGVVSLLKPKTLQDDL